jgi:hypothetical protein
MVANKGKAGRFPPGWLVVVLLSASGLLWAVMFFGTLAHLRDMAGGLAPFDVRPLGYSYDEARAFLAAIGEQGRAFYLKPTLVIDSFFPPVYAASHALALWWLTAPGRVRAAEIKPLWRWTLVSLPVVVAILDGVVENVCIAQMLWTWPDLSPRLVELASIDTRAKLVVGAVTEISLAALAVAALLRRRCTST